MADSTHNITIPVDVDTTDAQRDIKEFGRIAQQAIQSSDTKIQKMGLSLQNNVNKMIKLNSQMTELASKRIPTQEYTDLQNKIKEVTNNLKQAKASLSALESTSLHTEQYDYISKKIQAIQKELEQARLDLGRSIALSGDSKETDRQADKVARLEAQLIRAQEYQQKLIDTGQQYANADEFTPKIEQVQSLEQELQNLQSQEQAMKAAGTDTISGVDTSQYRDLANQASLTRQQSVYMANSMDQAANNASKMKSNLRGSTGVLETLKNKVGGLISKLSSLGRQSTATSHTHNTSFKKMLTTVLKYGFGIRSIFLLYKKVRTVISTGLSEMSKQFSDVADDVYTLKNSWSGFKASLVSAFQPILSYVVPVLTTLINYLTSAMNAIANFFALLTGQSYYYKAVKGNESVADSIGGTGSAAEDANEELAEYDDLIVIDQDSSSGGGGGGGSSSSDAWQWEKTNVEASTLADQLSAMWDVFKSAWENKGQAVIDAATTAFNNIKSLLSTIWNTIYSVFVSGTGQTWVESVLTLFTSILTTIGLIAEAWETAWKKDGNGYKLVESVFNMFTSINSTIATIQDSWNKAWTSDDTGVNIISNVLNTLTSIYNTITNISDNFRTAWETAGVGDEIMDTILGIVEDISGFISTIASDTEEWSENLDFYPLLDSVKNVLNSCRKALDLILTAAESLYKQYILKIVEHITESNIPDILNSVSEEVDGIVDSLDGFDWDHFFSTLESITELGLDNLTEIFKEKLSDLANVAKFAAEEITLLQKAIKTLESLGGANTLLSKIWNWLKKILDIVQNWTFSWENLFPGAGKVIESINTIQEAWESLKDLFDGGDYEGWGSDIFDGLVTGFSSGDWSDAIHSIWTAFIDTLKSVFGINSPAKNVKPYGEYIFDGLIEGIKSKFDSIKDTIQEFKDKLVSKISEKFSDIKERISEVIGDFSLSSLLGLEGDTNKIDIITTISSTFIGGLTSLLDFETFNTTWGNIKSSFKNISNTIKSKFSGIFSKIEDVDTLKTSWTNLKGVWKDVSAQLKATLGGKIREIVDLDTIQGKFVNLYESWKSKSAELKASVGGQLKKYTDLDTWKTTFTNLYDKWLSKDAVMSAATKINNVANEAITKLGDGNGGWTKIISDLTTAWHGSDASFTTEFDEQQSTLDSWYTTISNLADAWEGKKATFELTFSAAADDLKSWVNTNVISKINAQFDKVPILKNHHIPLLARGGIVDTATMFVAGEAGKEAVIPLEKNLEWLDNMATRISDKIMNLAIPDVVTGAILPASKEFVQVFNANTHIIETQLDEIIERLSILETNNSQPIMLQIDGRTIAQVVWDEETKRYRQVGVRYGY